MQDQVQENMQDDAHAGRAPAPSKATNTTPVVSHEPAVSIECDVSAQMRDGVTLRANVYRPAGEGPWPTLLSRTPYGKNLPGDVLELGIDPVHAARSGFMVVIQDTRGRFNSEGDWIPFLCEGADGYDSVEWAAQLPGSNGRVGMFGSSYCAITQWLAALQRPPSLAAISPVLSPAEPLDGLFARGGAVELGLALPWTLITGIDYLSRQGHAEADMSRRVTAIMDEWDRLAQSAYWEIPVSDLPVLRRHELSMVSLTRGAEEGQIAEACRVAGAQGTIQAASFHTAGWYDLFLQGSIDNYCETQRAGKDARLIIGPWTHESFADPIGEKWFGIRAGRAGAPAHPHGDVNELHLAWLRGHLIPEADVDLPDAPVRIFVMGRNEWRDEPTWPPQRAQAQRWFLGRQGSLSTAAPEAGTRRSAFIYDPENPVPTAGGHTLQWAGYPAGPIDQTRVEAREDVLVFTSGPLEEDLEVTGRVRVVLYAESSARSTDWVARLCDVHPDGRSFNICDGIMRVHNDAHECKRYEIDLWSTSNVFLSGHQLRVHVTSSSFPRWDRNLNTGNQRESARVPAHQRVYHDEQRPSHIELPVIA